MRNDERHKRDADEPDSTAEFHHLPGDLADTENAAARENRLSGPGQTAPGARDEREAADRARGDDESPPVVDASGKPAKRRPMVDDGGGRDASDTWTTKGNPLA